MAGLVGSSNNPISGVTICTITTAALMLYIIVGGNGERITGSGPGAAIFLGAVVACASAISGDNMQVIFN